MSARQVQHSKFLSLILRHQPELIGVQLDAQGWAELDDLLRLAAAHGTSITRQDVLDVVASSDKQRFAISEDGQRIRANQGHSVVVDLQLPAQTPPAQLLHGTATRFLDSIRESGLSPGSRQQVHLSASLDTAVAVGARHGQAVVLVVDAAAMHRDGHVFQCSANGVWLTDHVPPKYLRLPNPPQ